MLNTRFLLVTFTAACAAVAQSAAPDAVLARYEAALEHNDAPLTCRNVSMDIEASLPRAAKQGRIYAIRHLIFGKSHYEVLRTEGDPMVRRQVIARYLAAQVQSEGIASTAVAVTSANYRFRYLSSFGAGSNLSFVYRIKPRHKRVGLIDGELWIDAGSGLPAHQSGRLVKSPSAFLRRVIVTQDTDYRSGIPDRRFTRLDIETRLVGPAQITVVERPCAPTVTSVLAISEAPSGEDHDQACNAN